MFSGQAVLILPQQLSLSVRIMLKRAAVVGAGAAGLCAARHVLCRPTSFAPPVVFELTDNVGGTWCYDECVGTYDKGRPVHSSMYRDLRCVTQQGNRAGARFKTCC